MGDITVLLVEPHPEIREIYGRILRHHDYHVLETATGEDGLRLAVTNRIDLVISEHPVLLPDGATLTEALKRDTRTSAVPILTLTTFALPENLDQARSQGSADVLIKPVSSITLVAAVKRLARPTGAAELSDALSVPPLEA